MGDFLIKESNCCSSDTSCCDCESHATCKRWDAYRRNRMACKNYAHFDARTSLKSISTLSKVMDPNYVTSHGFWPFIHYQIPKCKYSKAEGKLLGKNKFRDIRYCAHIDRCIYQRYAFLLDSKYNALAKELGVERCATAYRTNLGKCNIDFAKEVFSAIDNLGECYVLVGDFASFFDQLSHIYLKEMLCLVLGCRFLPDDFYAVFKSLTRYSSWNWKDLIKLNGLEHETGARKALNSRFTVLSSSQFKEHVKSHVEPNLTGLGIPQGSPASAVLSNIYMLEFDQCIKDIVEGNGGIYRRYCDDFIAVIPAGKTKPQDSFSASIEPVLHYIETFEGVRLQNDKTFLLRTAYSKSGQWEGFQKCDLETGEDCGAKASLDYLGFVYDADGIRIRPRSITKYHYRMQKKCKGYARLLKAGIEVSPKNIYKIYAYQHNGRTFPNYVARTQRKLDLADPESMAVLRNSKGKIRKALKRATT